uniref:FYVE, RhoGEF and PH domain containing 3 n=1 Tax=Pseudonaja textilis TaxID=8673 RepID=A0A670YEP6_PSETE
MEQEPDSPKQHGSTNVPISKASVAVHSHKDTSVEMNSNGKIPNRDSGIDSPSCNVAGENFPNEEATEQKKTTGTGDLAEMDNDKKTVMFSAGEQKRDSAQDEDSDIDEGSSEDPDKCRFFIFFILSQYSEPQKLFNIANELLHTEEAYVNRDTNPRLGDILQKLAPFLKMYGEYVKNFDRAMDMVNTWMQRSSPFKDVIQNIQKQEICGNLTLQHHMLEPVQRIPRYELLLKDYLKKLPGESPDRKDAEKSLELISTAANHSNAAIRKMEKMHKLLEVYERLGGEEDIVNPANELIKEGHIQKLSAKNGTAQDRYLFLRNILVCLIVQEIVKQNVTHTFSITGKKRSLELQARTEEEKKDWIQVIQATIEKHKQNSETFRAFNNSFSQEDDSTSAGPECCRKSSKSKRDKEKQACKSCSESFNSITKRRHHCKQCGAVICAKCSEFKTLADNSRQNRVCKDCFQLPSANLCISGTEGKQSLLSSENSLFSSHLLFHEKGKAWCKVWVTIPKTEPLVLYLQGENQVGRIPRSIPLLGYEIDFPHSGEKFESKYVFKLCQSQQTTYFSAEDEDLQMKWMDILTKAAKGDIHDESEETSNP